MGYGSIVSIFDRLSVKTVLTNSTGSYIGFLSTLAFIAVCLIILIPPVNQYFKGAYFQSEFVSSQFPKNIYSTGDDLILAMVFKNKITGEYANHSDILQNINSFGYYYGNDATYKVDLMQCKPQVFLDAINPMQVKDCVMMPSGLEYNIEPVQSTIPIIEVGFKMKCDDVFKCSQNSPFYVQMQKYITNLSKNYYYEFIFNSKVLNQKGQQKNQFHKVYSTEYDSPDGLGTYFKVESAQKKYFVDDSILPWWNNRTYVNLFWQGKSTGSDVSAGAVVTYGFYSQYYVFTDYQYSYRYYKKLDFLLGMIGGAVFLLYLLFWISCSYINRTLQKIRNAQELLMTKDQIISTQQNLHKVKIPFWHVITRYSSKNSDNPIVQTAERQIDLVQLIKKLKVTHRNLRTKGLDITFKTRDVDLQTVQPEQFIPDRPALQNYQIPLQAYQALTKAENTSKIYENNAPVLALLQNNAEKLETVMQDEIYDKNKNQKRTCKEQIRHQIIKIIKFFDVFGAKPMLNAEPQTSSCWGFFLTLVIITLSVLTFCLTIKNMDSVKIITSERFQQPLEHNYLMTSGENFRFAFCVTSTSFSSLFGASKSVQLTFFKQSKKNGFQQLKIQRMTQGQFASYFQLAPEDPYAGVPAQYCFRPQDNQTIAMGGSFQSINEAYFGARLDPYCSGTPSQCVARKNKTITDFLSFVNYNTYGYYLSENKFSPEENKIISGIGSDQVSESNTVMNASLLRTETVYVSAIEMLDDTSKSFLRTPPKSIVKTMAYSNFGDRNQQRKGDPLADPGYILVFRPNGQVEQVILRSYKIDFILGLIGGVFVFWYFFVHFFAKIFNSFKVRAKLAEVLHQEDGYDESILVQILHLSKLSFLFCCSRLKQDVNRVSLVDEKMQRDLDYLYLVKNVDNCYRLSGSLFETLAEKDLSLIYFREKIDESEIVKPKRIAQVQKEDFEDDEFLQMDDEVPMNNLQQTSIMNASNTFLPQATMQEHNIDLDKILGQNKLRQASPLYDSMVPKKKQSFLSKIKRFDAFKNPAQLTLDGQRDVKSIIGGVMFFILATLIIIVVFYFLKNYLNGTDFTVSHRRIVDGNLDVITSGDTLGELKPGIDILSGSNFKFAVSFNKKDRYYPYNVSQYIGPIGIRMMQYTVTKDNGQVNESFVETEFIECPENYLNGFMSPYNDPQAFQNITLAYCLPDGVQLSLKGTPSDTTRTYFKMSIYNKYKNVTGQSYLNSFFKIFLVDYYLSVPRMDVFEKDFQYQMTKFNYFTDTYSFPIEQNLTFTKMIFTDKYYQRSRETYNDKSSKTNERLDVNSLSLENTRNLTFYYNGMLDQYTLDYPGGGELFGLVGGVIVLFVFCVYSCVASFNEYRMKYLIGQRLYTFDKKLSGLLKEKGRKINSKKIEQAIRKINNFNQLEIFLAWVLNPIGYIRDNYNFNKTLRRVTLLIDKVENDINLYNVYKNLFAFKNVIDKHVKLTFTGQQLQGENQPEQVNLSSVYIKHIYNQKPIDNHLPIIAKESKKHKLSPYEEFKIAKAIDQKVNPQTVLGDKVLNRAFGIDDGSSILDSRMKMHEEQQHNEEHQSEVQSKKKKKTNKTKNAVNENSNAKLQQADKLQESNSNFESFEIQQPEHH